MREWRLSYEKIREGIRPGDMLAFHGCGIISRGIAIYEHLKTRVPIQQCITHVAMVCSGPIILDRKLMLEADEGEVNARSVSATLSEYNGRVFWYPLREELCYFRSAMDLLCWNKIGKKYDYGSFFGNLFGNVSLDGRRYFCSELLQAVFQIVPEEIIDEILRHKEKTESDFPVLKLFFKKKALRPHQLIQLPFYKPRIEIILPR